MGIVSGTVTFIVIWWLVIFVVLPLGVSRKADIQEKGHDGGAPSKPGLTWKFILTTLIALLIWGVLYGVAESGIISFRGP